MYRQKTRPKMNYKWIRKTKKWKKKVKIKVKLPHVNKKPLARKRILFKHRFFSILESYSYKISRRKTTLVRSFSCFGVTQMRTPILLRKPKENVN